MSRVVLFARNGPVPLALRHDAGLREVHGAPLHLQARHSGHPLPSGSNNFLSVQEITDHLPSHHVNTTFLAQVLDDTAAYGILVGKSNGATGTTCYGLNALSSLLTVDQNSSSMAPWVLFHMHSVTQALWYHLAGSVFFGRLTSKSIHTNIDVIIGWNAGREAHHHRLHQPQAYVTSVMAYSNSI